MAVARLVDVIGFVPRTTQHPKVLVLAMCAFLSFPFLLLRTDRVAALLIRWCTLFIALGGIHLGPLSWLNTSSVVKPYLQYLENAAAQELFEFQVRHNLLWPTLFLSHVLDHG
jgi:hypothetical protein